MSKDYTKVILDNGIKLYVHGDKTLKKTIFTYSVNYGSSGEYFKFNYDNKEYKVLPGCAHFLEHMLLEHSRYGNLFKYFKSLKYDSNASTSFNQTWYYFTGVSKIKSSIKKMIYALEKPIFDTDDIKETSKAIIEETKIGLNDPYRLADALTAINLYANFDFCHESLGAIGNKETTEKLDYDTLKLCYDAFYYDENKSLMVVGPFEEKEMIDYIKNIYKGIKRHPKKTSLVIPDDLTKIRKKEDVIKHPTVEDDLLMVEFNNYFEGYSRFEIFWYLSFIGSSKFSKKTKFNEEMRKKGYLSFYEGTDYNVVLKEGQTNFGFIFLTKEKDNLLKEVMKELKINNFSKEDFELRKRKDISNYIFSLDDKYALYYTLLSRIIHYNEEFDYIDKVNELSFDKFIEFYNTIDFSNRVITLLTREV